MQYRLLKNVSKQKFCPLSFRANGSSGFGMQAEHEELKNKFALSKNKKLAVTIKLEESTRNTRSKNEVRTAGETLD